MLIFLLLLISIHPNVADAFHPFVDNLVNFIRVLSADKTIDESVFRNAVGAIGDLAHVYGAKVRPLLAQDFITKMVNEAYKSSDEDIKTIGDFAKKELKRIQ